MPVLLQVALGGAIGASLRYMSVQATLRLLGAGFPYGTLFVNVVGSFLMGLASIYFLHRLGHDRFAPLVMAGFLGGFTTFSAFSLDVVSLIEKGRIFAASGYVAGSVGLSIVALVIGVLVMRSLLS